MAFRLVTAICDSLSQTRNQTHANQMIDMSGAVRRRISPRSILIARIFRLARLCVLIVNPIPARRSIHLDLAGSGILLSCRSSLVDPPMSRDRLDRTTAKALAPIDDAVSTYNLFSWAPEPPGDPQEGVTRAILPSGPSLRRRITLTPVDRSTQISLRTGACGYSLPRQAPGR